MCKERNCFLASCANGRTNGQHCLGLGRGPSPELASSSSDNSYSTKSMACAAGLYVSMLRKSLHTLYA